MESEALQPGMAEFTWQQSRRRPEGHFDEAVQGFGPTGAHTLWLPSPRSEVRYRFVEGKPVREAVASCMDDAAISELRNRVIESFSDAAGIYTADVAFLEYTATIIRTNYNSSDADLEFLLSGNKWHSSAMAHLLGGEDTCVAFAQAAADRRRSIPTPDIRPSKPKLPSALTRLFRRWK